MAGELLNVNCSYAGYYSYACPTRTTGRCYLHVYEGQGAIPVVIVTEPADNPGPSVTNATEQIATQLWRDLLPHARDGFRLIEVYLDPANPDLGAERFAEVSYIAQGHTLTQARYIHTTRATVEALIDAPLAIPFASSY